MTRITHACSIALTLLALAFVAPPAVAADGDAPARRPNIVFLLIDDFGMGDVACYGGTLVPTPNIDRLASEGIRFTRYYSAAPICSAARCGLITGMYPARWRITSFLQTRAGNRKCEQADFLDPAAPSLPRQLQAAGYATAHFGKWHLGGGRDVVDAPKFAAYGYDEHAGTYESPEPDPNITATNWIWSPKDKVKRWERTGYFVDKTLDFLRRQKQQGANAKPCFVNVWLDDTHTPWVPGPDAPKGDTPRNLKPVLAEMDRQVGRLMDGIRELGIDRDTLVIFVSDNGPLPTFKGARSAGMRGAKLSLYEAGVRLPFIVRWPGQVPAGKVDEQSVISGVDMLPTLCAIAGAKPPENAKLDGHDVSAALRGSPAAQRDGALFWEYGRNKTSFGYPRIATDRSPNLAVREGRWKLLINDDGTGAELYDVTKDVSESINVATHHPEVTKALTEKVLGWRRGLP